MSRLDISDGIAFHLTHRGAFFDTRLQPIENRAIYERLVDLLCEPQLNLFVTVHSKAEFRRDQSSLSEKHLIRAFSERVWRQYLYDYERYLLEQTRLIGHSQNALLYFDSNPSQEKYIRRITRDFARRFDQQDSFPNAGIVEDIIFRDSKTSYLIQLADILAFSMHRITLRGDMDEPILTEQTINRLVQKIQERQNGEMV